MMQDQTYTPDRSKLYHFKLDRILGEGGTGRVYRGIDTKKGQVAAVKLFHEQFFRNRMHVRDLAKSVKKIRKLEHKNIVKIDEFIDGDEGRVMSMEYVDGPNLKWYILNRPWNLKERIGVVQSICYGLGFLHDHECNHFDFKPSNILFTRRGVLKIADYSLYGGSLLMEIFGQRIGEQITPMFVAPEFIRRDKVTHSADLYSLGITMYMMFANRVPFPVDNLQQLYQCHLRFTPDEPSTVNPECPRELGEIILRLMAKKPEDRFKDCHELRSAIEGIGKSRI